MEDEELDEVRKKKAEAKKAQDQLKTTLRMALDETAYDRLMNISAVNKELYLTAAQNVLVFFKRAGRRMGDSELLSLLRAIKDQNEKKTSITFHKK
ncbi:MAG: DNA-binding protein [Candidatus Micrarchaeia archaeon]